MTEVKDASEEVVVEVKKDGEVVEIEEPTIGEVLIETKEPRTVPEAVFLETKNKNKELARELKELRTQIEQGGTKDTNVEITKLAEEYGVDTGFATKLYSTLQKNMEGSAKAEIEARLKPFEDRDKIERIKNTFNSHYSNVIAEMGDYKDIVNKEVIFALSLDPNNAKKTVSQLIEETYSNALTGKKSIETTTPRGGTEPGKLDLDRASKDNQYLQEVLKDPILSKQYREHAQELASRM